MTRTSSSRSQHQRRSGWRPAGMTRTATLALALSAACALALQACDCGPTGADQRRYACTADDQCAAGFVCVAGECQRLGNGPPIALGFSTAPQTVAAGNCSGVMTVQARDGAGSPVAVSSATAISLSATPSTGFLFYSDTSCTSPVASATIAAGTAAASFFFRGTLVGSVNVTAAAASLSSASQAESVIAGPPAALAFTSAAQLVTAGACSAPVRVEVEDAFGNPTAVSLATAVTLSASPASGFAFFSDGNCTSAVTGVNVAAGASFSGFFFRGTVAGAVAISGSSLPLTSAGQSETIAAGPASTLAFSTTPQVLAAGGCSSAATVQARDAFGNPANVSTSTTVALSASPSAGFLLFAGTGCAPPGASVSIPAGADSVSFSFGGTTAGGVTVSATTTSLGSASQTEAILAGPPASLEISTAPQTVLARDCSGALTLTFRDIYGNAAPVASATAVPLSSGSVSGPSFSGNAGCASVIGAATFPSGASSATVFFRGRTGGTFTVTASPSGMAAVSQDEVILPTVRRGSCTVPAGLASVVCPISPAQSDLSHTFLVFQAVPGADAFPASSNVRCRFTSTSSIACSRAGASAVPVLVSWQTVELPSGMRVQHVDAACGTSNVVSVPISPILAIGSTFVLASHEEPGVSQDEDDTAMVELTSPTNVDLTLNSTCSWLISLEVVDLFGTLVTAGRVQLAANASTATATGLPAGGAGSTVLLHSHATAVTSNPGICDRVVRGQVDTSTSVRFRRGNGTANPVCSEDVLDLAYQRIDFGSLGTVQEVPALMFAGDLTADVTINAVDMTRTVVMSGGMPMGGEAMGETDYAADDVIGEAAALHQLTSSTNLRLTRGSANATAQWSAYVIQIE